MVRRRRWGGGVVPTAQGSISFGGASSAAAAAAAAEAAQASMQDQELKELVALGFPTESAKVRCLFLDCSDLQILVRSIDVRSHGSIPKNALELLWWM